MNRKNMDDIFRDGLKNYNSEIDPNEIWAGIQDKKPNPKSDNRKPFAWWILGSLLLLISATVLLSTVVDNQSNAIETAEAKISNMSMVNQTNSTTTTPATTEANVNSGEAKTATTTTTVTTNEKENDTQFLNSAKVSNARGSSKTKTIAEPINAERNRDASIDINSLNTSDNRSNQSTIISTPNPTELSIPLTNYNNKSTSPQFESNSIKKKVIAFDFLDNKEAIPVIPMTDEEEDFTTTEIPDMSTPPSEIAQGCYGGRPFSFAIGAHLSPDLVMHRISSTNQDLFPYIDERRKTEKLLESYHVGLDVYLQHRDGLFLRSGVEYAQINKRFKFDETWVEFNDSTNVTTTFVREKKTTNRYRLVDIPLTVGYEFGINDWNLALYVEAGASMNVLFKKKGDILDPNSPSDYYEPISITDGEANSLDSYVENVGLSFLGGIGARYELMDGLFIYAQPAGKIYLNSFTKKDNTVNEKFSRIGLNLGAIYKL